MKTRKLPSAFFAALLLASPAFCSASELDELKAHVAALEARITSLEKSLKPLITKAEVEQLRTLQQIRARRRMRQDTAKYSQNELREIESLYQVANKKWGTDEAQDSLRTLVEKYEKANRTGCAVLYPFTAGGRERVRS